MYEEGHVWTAVAAALAVLCARFDVRTFASAVGAMLLLTLTSGDTQEDVDPTKITHEEVHTETGVSARRSNDAESPTSALASHPNPRLQKRPRKLKDKRVESNRHQAALRAAILADMTKDSRRIPF